MQQKQLAHLLLSIHGPHNKSCLSCTPRLQQILYNLLGNAIKFSSKGGLVEIHVEHADTLEPFLRFAVKDYGRGIEKENFKKIFHPFLQASNDTERIYGGTGKVILPFAGRSFSQRICFLLLFNQFPRLCA